MAQITREDVAVIEKAISPGILSGVPKTSVVLSLMTKLPNMAQGKETMRVFDVLPSAYWVNGDSGRKQTTKAAWDKVYINAEEIAVIIPIPEAVLNDADYDIVGEILPKVQEAFGRVIDEAIIFGKNKPLRFRNDIITSARNAGNNVKVTATANYYDLLLGKDGVISKVEQAGTIPNGVIAALNTRALLRGIKDSTGRPLYVSDMKGQTPYAIDGNLIFFPENGSFDASIASLIAGDWKQAVYSIRQDVTVKLLTEGVIQDPKGDILYNLAQQDMVGLRIVMRLGWQLPNPATQLDQERTTFPFAFLEASTGQSYKTQKVTITVNDAAAKAVVGAVVSIGGSRLKTNNTGVVEFNLNSGTYDMSVSANGYAKQVLSIVVNDKEYTQTVSLIAAK
jgi:HK97 family phage major capsid protein